MKQELFEKLKKFVRLTTLPLAKCLEVDVAIPGRTTGNVTYPSTVSCITWFSLRDRPINRRLGSIPWSTK